MDYSSNKDVGDIGEFSDSKKNVSMTSVLLSLCLNIGLFS